MSTNLDEQVARWHMEGTDKWVALNLLSLMGIRLKSTLTAQ
jgi:hypothetical protein